MQYCDETYENAIIIPTTNVYTERAYYGGCIYDHDKNIINSSLRGPINCVKFIGSKNDLSKIDINNINIVYNDAIYLGYFSYHYGHFLIETLGRMKYILDNNIEDLILVFNRWFRFEEIDKYNETLEYNSIFLTLLINIFNLSYNKIIIVNKPTKFKKITIPKQNAYINHSINDEQHIIYKYIINQIKNTYIDQIITTYKRLFLLRNDNRIKNEKDILEVFKNFGFVARFLQDNSLIDDIYTINKAEIIAGIEGTALHNCIFMEPSKHVISINSSNRFLSKNQQILCDLSRTKVYEILYKGINDNIDIEYLKNTVSKILISIDNSVVSIKQCTYGGIDVSDIIKNNIKNNYLNLFGNFNEYFGDPQPNIVKYLHIMLKNGNTLSYQEGENVLLNVSD